MICPFIDPRSLAFADSRHIAKRDLLSCCICDVGFAFFTCNINGETNLTTQFVLCWYFLLRLRWEINFAFGFVSRCYHCHKKSSFFWILSLQPIRLNCTSSIILIIETRRKKIITVWFLRSLASFFGYFSLNFQLVVMGASRWNFESPSQMTKITIYED